MKLEDLEIYGLARELNKYSWIIYNQFNWQEKKTMGDQFITAVDSIGANIAEGFGRFHYLDKNKFNYNARGSLLESIYWLDVLRERGKINTKDHISLKETIDKLHRKLNSYISITKIQKANV
ncbi:MAG: hypothetical protein A3I24_02970 [Candidatus Harrisonbacteria bacterium RIFCSPLOWO2_02_FULL_41_13b]|uniref:Four helix bundle protein n=1 Tax=Candidatus Harrisonbacteria bacterium RIFCSPLOWO2_02_FULL_41_13b TaxID=1798409 RepID=A0A1G1ZU72_9BACT|nr:MAG: hypothetical protein A3J53_02995 [Candidatus Harrisonbacteria bacterium RIFCSPHIGHO2_02_FULL_40_20]OGY68005.1 MAG: hypothetical protein A3I24_02970 [Candidatus Harrisonbacteria bacterium RIFCSPLOWO2_02_FULL_41_13b]